MIIQIILMLAAIITKILIEAGGIFIIYQYLISDIITLPNLNFQNILGIVIIARVLRGDLDFSIEEAPNE